MLKNIKLKYPDYLDEFKCIGGACKDSCCQGWDIEIDKASFKSYFKVTDKEMKKRFQKCLYNNEYMSDASVDYGKVKLKEKRKCEFLNENNLCDIFINIGENYLSNVCTCYPRILNKIDDFYEMTLDVACPTAAEIILNKEEGINFKEDKRNFNKYIIAGNINTKAKEHEKTVVKYFKEIRDKSILIVKNRNYTISERLYILGIFLETLQEKSINHIKDFINNFNEEEALKEYELNDTNYLLQTAFLKELLDKMDVFNEIDSEGFKEYTKILIKGLKLNDIKNIGNNSEFYINSYKNYVDNVVNKYSFIFENYLVNFMYNNLFPFSENEYVFHGYIMLVIRYSLIRFYLVGIYNKEEDKSKELIIKVIQKFSKAVEHHYTFLSETLEYIVNNEFDNMEFVSTLL